MPSSYDITIHRVKPPFEDYQKAWNATVEGGKCYLSAYGDTPQLAVAALNSKWASLGDVDQTKTNNP